MGQKSESGMTNDEETEQERRDQQTVKTDGGKADFVFSSFRSFPWIESPAPFCLLPSALSLCVRFLADSTLSPAFFCRSPCPSCLPP